MQHACTFIIDLCDDKICQDIKICQIYPHIFSLSEVASANVRASLGASAPALVVLVGVVQQGPLGATRLSDSLAEQIGSSLMIYKIEIHLTRNILK